MGNNADCEWTCPIYLYLPVMSPLLYWSMLIPTGSVNAAHNSQTQNKTNLKHIYIDGCLRIHWPAYILFRLHSFRRQWQIVLPDLNMDSVSSYLMLKNYDFFVYLIFCFVYNYKIAFCEANSVLSIWIGQSEIFIELLSFYALPHYDHKRGTFLFMTGLCFFFFLCFYLWYDWRSWITVGLSWLEDLI